MSFPGITTGRNLVIASVQSSPNVTPNFQENTDEPTSRPNGGDLLVGDTWWNPDDQTFYVWDGTQWVWTGGALIDCGGAGSHS